MLWVEYDKKEVVSVRNTNNLIISRESRLYFRELSHIQIIKIGHPAEIVTNKWPFFQKIWIFELNMIRKKLFGGVYDYVLNHIKLLPIKNKKWTFFYHFGNCWLVNNLFYKKMIFDIRKW